MTYKKVLKALSLAVLAGFVVTMAGVSAAYLAQRNKQDESEADKFLVEGVCGGVAFVAVFSLALFLLLRKQKPVLVNTDNIYTPLPIEAIETNENKNSDTPALKASGSISVTLPINIIKQKNRQNASSLSSLDEEHFQENHVERNKRAVNYWADEYHISDDPESPSSKCTSSPEW